MQTARTFTSAYAHLYVDKGQNFRPQEPIDMSAFKEAFVPESNLYVIFIIVISL